MPSADTETTEGTDATEPVVDEAREALVEALRAELGDALVATEIEAGHDLWVRVATESWGDVAEYLRERQRFRFFEWLSAIDWMPSPFGRSMNAAVDLALGLDDDGGDDDETPAALEPGICGGDTRFQVFARLHNLGTRLGITLKADVPDEPFEVPSWTGTYPGAEWHEREAWEMFGIGFTGHPGLRALYLPSDFQGNPMRKDFPLLARLIKPWPGITDVEPMPEVPEPEAIPSPADADPLPATEAPETGSAAVADDQTTGGEA